MDLSAYSNLVCAAGVLLARSDGRTLLVRTHHRVGLVLPGGMVEPGESPVERHVDGGRARLHAAFAARRNGSTAYVDGDRVLT